MGAFSVEFDQTIYSVNALHAAIYRMIGSAVGKIHERDGLLVCELSGVDEVIGVDLLRKRFLEVVADEVLREKLSAQTEPLRNLILSLAFGALALEEKSSV